MNGQLRTLICAEVVLHKVCPVARRVFRGVYDWVGPRLARRVRTPWQADLAYLTMKPLEWAAWLLLMAVFGDPRQVVGRLGRHGGKEA